MTSNACVIYFPIVLIKILQSHYSIKKASAALGFGTDNLILLNTDERFALHLTYVFWSDVSLSYNSIFFSRGRVIPADLEAKVIEAKQKVNVSNNESDMSLIYLPLPYEKHSYVLWSLLVVKGTLKCAGAARLFQ